MPHHVVPVKTYVMVFLSLVVFTVLTTAVSYIDLGPFNTVVAMVIAFCKMLLVVLFFMHLRYTKGVVPLTLFAGIFWLALLIGLTLSDYQSRAWTPVPAPWSTTAPPTHP